MSRTKRQKKTGAKAVSWHCRNHGECDWCRTNRTYNTLRDLMRIEDLEKEFIEEKPVDTYNRFFYKQMPLSLQKISEN